MENKRNKNKNRKHRLLWLWFKFIFKKTMIKTKGKNLILKMEYFGNSNRIANDNYISNLKDETVFSIHF